MKMVVQKSIMMQPKNTEFWAAIFEKYGLSVIALIGISYTFYGLFQTEYTDLKTELRTQVQILSTRVERLEREKEFLLHENAALKAKVEQQEKELSRLRRR